MKKETTKRVYDGFQNYKIYEVCNFEDMDEAILSLKDDEFYMPYSCHPISIDKLNKSLAFFKCQAELVRFLNVERAYRMTETLMVLKITSKRSR